MLAHAILIFIDPTNNLVESVREFSASTPNGHAYNEPMDQRHRKM